MKRSIKTFLALATVSVTSLHAVSAATIGAHFLNNNNGGPQTSPFPLAGDEVAGAPGYAQTNWNSLGRWGQTVALKNSVGDDSGVTLTWDSNNTWNNGGATATPNGKLMYGYLDATGQANWVPENPYQFWWNENKPEAYATGLTAWRDSYGAANYTVVVYADGDATSGRIAEYWLQEGSAGDPPTMVGVDLTARVFLRDSENFSGTFTQVPLSADSVANAADGNFIVFTGLTNDSFVLRTEERTGDQLRAVINAIQIIPNIEKPFIQAQPQLPGDVYVGEMLNLSVVALGPSLAYQWRKNSLELSGETSAAFSKSSLTIEDSGDYDVVITNSSGSVTSSPVTITVFAERSPADAVVSPTALSRRAGGAAAFAVTAVGTTPFTYQWHKDGSPLTKQTNASLTLTNLTLDDTGDYTCGVSNFLGGTVSTIGALIVTTPAGTTIGLNFQDGLGLPVTAPAFGTDTADWVNLTPGANGVEIAGGLSVAWSSRNTWRQGAGFPAGEGEIAFGYLDDGSPGNSVTISGLTEIFGAFVIETIGASDYGVGLLNVMLTNGPQTLTYSATRDSAGELTGVSSLSTPLFDDAIGLRGQIGDSGGTRGGLAGILLTDKPVIAVQPRAPDTIYNGAFFRIAGLNAAGVPELAFQWRKGRDILPGATNAIYTKSGVSAADLGEYDVVVTNSFGSVTSSIVTINSVADLPALAIEVFGADLFLTWPAGALLEADNLSGPWSTNNAFSPYPLTPTAARKFYRLLVQ